MRLGLGEALIIFIGLIIINIALIFVNLFKKGILVKNIVVFSIVQGYTLLVAILLLIYQADGRISGYIIGSLFILVSIACMVLRKTKFDLVRFISAESVFLVYLSFWYYDKFVLIFIISLIVYAATIGYRYYKEKY